MASICADLSAEHAALDETVAVLDDDAWDRETPAAGWAIRDQIGHLTYFDRTAAQSALDPVAFEAERDAALTDLSAFEAATLAPGRELSPAALLTAWRAARSDLLDALTPLDPASRLPWYGPPMAARSFATARLMETWAHGTDVRDALGLPPVVSDRLRHVAHIGVRARTFSYAVHGLEPPAEDVFVALDPPAGGDLWTWGAPEATDQVRGAALDFCLAVTQRRVLDDVALEITGDGARQWLSIAQAFAGPPTTTPPERQGVGAVRS